MTADKFSSLLDSLRADADAAAVAYTAAAAAAVKVAYAADAAVKAAYAADAADAADAAVKAAYAADAAREKALKYCADLCEERTI